jgi:hypothetical protein
MDKSWMLWFRIVVECKSSKDRPWIVFTAPEHHSAMQILGRIADKRGKKTASSPQPSTAVCPRFQKLDNQ